MPLNLAELKLGRDPDGALQRPVDRTAVVKHPMHALGNLAVRGIGLQAEPHVNAPNDENALLFLHLADRFSDQPPGAGRNLTRLQRASIGSDESAGSRGNDVVERGRVRLDFGRRPFEIMLRHGTVNAETDGLGFGGKKRAAERTLDPFNSHLGAIDDVGHSVIVRLFRA